MLNNKWTDKVLASSTKYFKQSGINPSKDDILDFISNEIEKETGAFQINNNIARKLIKEWLKSKEIKA